VNRRLGLNACLSSADQIAMTHQDESGRVNVLHIVRCAMSAVEKRPPGSEVASVVDRKINYSVLGTYYAIYDTVSIIFECTVIT
jgi:hypothetical protein